VKTDADSKWVTSPHIRPTYSQDGAVVLHIEQGLCYSLNVVAAQVLVAIETSPNGITLDGILGAVETHFPVRPPEFAGDIAECLDKLQRMGLIHSNDNAGPNKSTEGKR
jgi:hypothetical protein